MGPSIAALFVALALLTAAAFFAGRASQVLRESNRRLMRLKQDLATLQREKEDRLAARDQLVEQLKEARETDAELTRTLTDAEETLRQLEAKPPTPVYSLSKKADPAIPVFMATVRSPRGFDRETWGGGGRMAAGDMQERIFAGPAESEEAFRQDLLQRFPLEDDYEVGPVSVFLHPDRKAAAQRSVA